MSLRYRFLYGGSGNVVKVWNTLSGFCFVTFADHLGGITGVEFGKKGTVVISSSLDGTVRAFDLNRYRNFRTLTSPRPAQFSCLAVDRSGDLVCAGGLDVFEIFVWSIQTGRLLEILSGHESPISSLSFARSHAILVSASWDKTVKLWDVFENKAARESLTFNADVMCVAYRPDGEELAVCTLTSEISFWNVRSAAQTGSIDGKRDLGYSRKELDKITAKKSAGGKSFSALAYTVDGKCILAAGRSKNVCIFSVKDQMLLKKFEISCNYSLDGMEEYLARRKMTEWGSLALVDEGRDDGKALALPGVRTGDMSKRSWKPEVRVTSLQFSPTGRAWAATSTEGLLLYSLDHNLVFDPFHLEENITPESIRQNIGEKNYRTALMMSFRLNEKHLIQECMEQVPVSDVQYICESLPDVYVKKLLDHVAGALEQTRHFEFYLNWTCRLLTYHGTRLKRESGKLMGSLRMLQKVLTRRGEELAKICDHNKYAIQYLISLPSMKRKLNTDVAAGQDSDSDDDSMEAEVETTRSEESMQVT